MLVFIFLLSTVSCGTTENAISEEDTFITQQITDDASETELSGETVSSEEAMEVKMNVQVGKSMFTATLEKNEAAEAFVDMMESGPVEIQMSDYSGFEKVGDLGESLPTSNRQITTQSGDIVLYQGNQIVVFYGSNSWSYTRLGKIDDLSGWEEDLGSDDVMISFSLTE